jgi:hypothetical protein
MMIGPDETIPSAKAAPHDGGKRDTIWLPLPKAKLPAAPISELSTMSVGRLQTPVPQCVFQFLLPCRKPYSHPSSLQHKAKPSEALNSSFADKRMISLQTVIDVQISRSVVESVSLRPSITCHATTIPISSEGMCLAVSL